VLRRTCITHTTMLTMHGRSCPTEQLIKRFGHGSPSIAREHYIKQLEAEPPHSRGEHLDFSIEHHLKVAGVAERKAAIDAIVEA
jgi:hypothetical protein